MGNWWYHDCNIILQPVLQVWVLWQDPQRFYRSIWCQQHQHHVFHCFPGTKKPWELSPIESDWIDSTDVWPVPRCFQDGCVGHFAAAHLAQQSNLTWAVAGRPGASMMGELNGVDFVCLPRKRTFWTSKRIGFTIRMLFARLQVEPFFRCSCYVSWRWKGRALHGVFVLATKSSIPEAL